MVEIRCKSCRKVKKHEAKGMCLICYGAWKRREKGMKPRSKGETILTVTCEWCGIQFKRSLGHRNTNEKLGRKQVCSPSCRGQLRVALLKGMGERKVMFQCAACGNVCEKKLSYWNMQAKIGKENDMCCNRRCAAYWRNGKRYEGKRMEPRLVDNLKVKL